jgi:hypothetical protein
MTCIWVDFAPVTAQGSDLKFEPMLMKRLRSGRQEVASPFLPQTRNSVVIGLLIILNGNDDSGANKFYHATIRIHDCKISPIMLRPAIEILTEKFNEIGNGY